MDCCWKVRVIRSCNTTRQDGLCATTNTDCYHTSYTAVQQYHELKSLVAVEDMSGSASCLLGCGFLDSRDSNCSRMLDHEGMLISLTKHACMVWRL